MEKKQRKMEDLGVPPYMEPPYGSHKTSGLHHQRPAGGKNSTTLPLAEGRDIRKNVSPLILTISNIHPKKNDTEPSISHIIHIQ